MQLSNQAARIRLGLIVFLALMVVEVVEYIVGVSMSAGALPILVVLAVPGAGLIMYYFMHIRQLWRPEE